MRTYTQLTIEERYMIGALRSLGAGQADIARCLGRAASTISRELRRNAYRTDGRYRAYHAARMANGRIELIAPEHTYLDGPPHGFNMLAVKDRALLENDLFVFRHHVSPKLLMHKDPALHHPIDD